MPESVSYNVDVKREKFESFMKAFVLIWIIHGGGSNLETHSSNISPQCISYLLNLVFHFNSCGSQFFLKYQFQLWVIIILYLIIIIINSLLYYMLLLLHTKWLSCNGNLTRWSRAFDCLYHWACLYLRVPDRLLVLPVGGEKWLYDFFMINWIICSNISFQNWFVQEWHCYVLLRDAIVDSALTLFETIFIGGAKIHNC